MKTQVIIEQQPRKDIERQPPDARKQLRQALHALENQEIPSTRLEDDLEGFCKLKVNRHRLILQLDTGDSGPRYKAVFAERRKAVYELFSQILGLE